MTFMGFFNTQVMPSVVKLEQTMGITRIKVQQESETIKLTNSSFFDRYKNDGRKHLVWMPF